MSIGYVIEEQPSTSLADYELFFLNLWKYSYISLAGLERNFPLQPTIYFIYSYKLRQKSHCFLLAN